jgi:DNA mismatch repair protein MutL
MGKICVLPEVLASQVAAGEVVERPASAVKELVENSLDAGATQIEVRVDRGGLALLRVSDDGCGMSREDALLSLERHATSKLRTVADLAAIRTLGFRGEALPSIASVSRFGLHTREANALAGTEVSVDGGKILNVCDWGGAPGTVIEVRGLFANVPARRKFLRSENTEFAHIEQTVRVQALANPHVGFTLLRDGRVIFQLPTRGSLRTRIEGLTGPDIASGLLERTEIERSGLRVRGWVGAPGRSRTDRSLTLVFINGRPVESPVIHYALRAAYGDALARGQHPTCFLFVDMDPAAVDVNVHPSKKEVRFRDGLGVQATIASLIQETLRSGARRTMTGGGPDQPPAEPLSTQPSVPPLEATFPSPASPTAAVSTVPATAIGPALRPAFEAAQRRFDLASTPPTQSQSSPPASSIAPETLPAATPFRVLGLLGPGYAVLESDEGLVLMHLRAAHERVLYEELRRSSAIGNAPMQPLLVPLTLHLTPRDFALVRENNDALRALGFAIEEFGANTIKLEGLPAALRHADPSAFLTGLLDDFAHSGESSARSRLDADGLAVVVCARAVPHHSPLGIPEIDALLRRLLACDMPYCDPAGRPTLVQLSFPELARKFGRRP